MEDKIPENNQETKQDVKKKDNSLFAVILSLMQGIVMGLSAIIVPGSEFVKKSELGEFLLAMMAVFVLLFVIITLNVIIHELGHLLCGIKSGYRFVSYRVFNVILAKYNDGKKLKKFSIPGTAGQSVLEPPAYDDGRYPYKLYLMGGLIGNIILTVIFAVLGLVIGLDTIVGRFMIAAALMSLFTYLTNGIPLVAGGVANDAYDIKSLGEDELGKRVFWISLDYNAKTQFGARPAELKGYLDDLPLENRKLSYDNKLTPSVLAMKAAMLYDELRFEEAGEIIKEALGHKELLSLYKNEFLCEKLFLELIGECDKAKIEKIYNKNLRAYMSYTHKCMISKSRIMYAYYKLYKQDMDKANKELIFFNRLCRNYPNLGEIASEKAIVEYVMGMTPHRQEADGDVTDLEKGEKQ